MILYTPLCQEDIFSEDLDEQASYQVISLESKSLYVKRRDDQQYEIIQVLSTNPQDFIDGHLQPGQIFTPKEWS